MRARLTDKTVASFGPRNTRYEVHDQHLTGLSIRVSEKGGKSWYVLYRVAGQGDNGLRGELKRLKIGEHPLMGLAAARDAARKALELADYGKDITAERAAARETKQTRAFEAVFERFVELHVKQNTKEGRFAKQRAAALSGTGPAKPKGPTSKLGRVAAERIIADHALPKWRGRLIETITRAEVHDLLDDVVKSKGEALARELRKHLTKMFNWAADRGQISSSPLAGMRRPELGYTPRERVLSMDELERVWAAAGDAGYPFGQMVRLIMLTGQRRSEIAEMERGWIDADQRAVEIPASRYKTKRAHVFPLSEPAWALYNALPKWNSGECVFSTTGGARPVSGFSKAKARLDKLIAKRAVKDGLPPMAPWTVHDIRRSVATHMARLGIPQEHIERVLGHVVQGVAGTYNRYSYLAEKRAALEAWGKLWKA